EASPCEQPRRRQRMWDTENAGKSARAPELREDRVRLPYRTPPAHITQMVWFRKERKPRQPRREKLEIPADAWEKCEACGHTDLREKFVRNLNVCPQCDYHRSIRASDYVNILMDDGSWEELDVDLRSVDPLAFPDYPARLKKAIIRKRERVDRPEI